MAPKTLLELTTDAPERSAIKVDGKTYELRSRDDLGLKEDAEFRRLMKEFADAQPGQDWEKMASFLNSMVKTVVIDIPDEVLAKLSDGKKLKIIEAFTQEVGASRPPASPAPAAQLAEAARA